MSDVRTDVPADRQEVLCALRLGWYLAEVRGRLWPDGQRPPNASRLDREGNALPLRNERSEAERQIEALHVLASIAAALDVDHPGADGPPAPCETYSASVEQLARQPGPANGSRGRAETRWSSLAELFYRWDAHIQDSLSGRSEPQACAYQLGRGLAEVVWALPRKPGNRDWHSYVVDREAELTRLLSRLTDYLDPLTPAAISGSLRVWAQIAADPQWREAEHTTTLLYAQSRRWYGLVVLAEDPRTLVAPARLRGDWRVTLAGLKLFAPQLAAGALGCVAVAGLAYLASTSSGFTWLKTLLGLLAALGVSGASVQARLKNVSQSLLARLRQETYLDLVAVAATEAPPRPSPGQHRLSAAGRRDAEPSRVEDVVGGRALTAACTPTSAAAR
jgi:hypothetical protein